MRKTLFTLSLFLLLCCAGFSVLRVNASNDVQVGVLYFAWNEAGLNVGHWNSSALWRLIGDERPLLGYYGSNDSDVCRSHIIMMHSAGISWLMIDWWGETDVSDNATKTLFSSCSGLLAEFNMKACVIVEGINESGVYDFGYIHNYIWDNFASPYSSVYMRILGKPVCCFFQYEHMTDTVEKRDAIHSDSRFENRIVGWATWCDWAGWTPYCYGSGLEPVQSGLDGFVWVTPRYDERGLGNDGLGVNRTDTFDLDYRSGLYQHEWNVVKPMVLDGSCKFICIYAWNEFNERATLEPCFDATSFTSDSFYLLNLTRANIESLSISYGSKWYENSTYAFSFGLTLFLACCVVGWAVKKR